MWHSEKANMSSMVKWIKDQDKKNPSHHHRERRLPPHTQVHPVQHRQIRSFLIVYLLNEQFSTACNPDPQSKQRGKHSIRYTNLRMVATAIHPFISIHNPGLFMCSTVPSARKIQRQQSGIQGTEWQQSPRRKPNSTGGMLSLKSELMSPSPTLPKESILSSVEEKTSKLEYSD